ncbi:hypothetical protein [Paenibacillus sp. P3E]|uniref:hypothetical protein n=1 Tax=Paenibacillus sp. P3E TaxID=1349435 RepID=UPI000A938FB9|nr:hypothetical protein [Paenibacillus sp. P3E]
MGESAEESSNGLNAGVQAEVRLLLLFFEKEISVLECDFEEFMLMTAECFEN